MQKRKWFIPVVVVSVLLIGGITGGVVAAVNNSSSNTTAGNESQATGLYQALLDRACDIYEETMGVAIDPGQLKEALEQAGNEMRNETATSWLQDLVDKGKITQEEADQYLEWLQSRPSMDLPVPGLGWCGNETATSWLQNLVDKSKITQEETDQYLEWLESRPDIGLPLPGLGGHGSGSGMMWGRLSKAWGGRCSLDASDQTGG